MDGWTDDISTSGREYQNYGGYAGGHTLPCGCPEPWSPDTFNQCTLSKPLLIVIPPKGIHLSCPVHSAGHHIYGSRVHC